MQFVQVRRTARWDMRSSSEVIAETDRDHVETRGVATGVDNAAPKVLRLEDRTLGQLGSAIGNAGRRRVDARLGAEGIAVPDALVEAAVDGLAGIFARLMRRRRNLERLLKDVRVRGHDVERARAAQDPEPWPRRAKAVVVDARVARVDAARLDEAAGRELELPWHCVPATPELQRDHIERVPLDAQLLDVRLLDLQRRLGPTICAAKLQHEV